MSFEFGIYGPYIWAAYAVSLGVIGLLVVHSILQGRND
jgi:heme exporter protein CcmD